jgi:hypothetical protein
MSSGWIRGIVKMMQQITQSSILEQINFLLTAFT